MTETYQTNETNHLASTQLRARLFKGTGAQAFGQVVHVLIRLSEVPLLLGFWGTQLYGEWLMLSAIPAYLSIGDGGFSTAACREMTMRSGAGDRQGALTVFQSTWLLLIAVSVAALILAFGFVKIAPLHEWLGFSAMGDQSTRLVLLILVIHVLVGFQGGLLNGGFWVTGRYPSGMYLQAVTQLLEFCGLALGVILGGGPVQAASGFLGGRVCGTILIWLGQRRASPWLRYGFAHASLSELRRLTAPAFASLAFPLGNSLNIQGMRLVVGLALGPSAVAVFTTLRTLSRLALQPRAVINALVEPELALAYGAGGTPLFRNLFSRSCQLALWGCIGVCLFVGPGANWIFPVWTSGKIAIHWPVYIILLAAVLVNSFWFTALMVPYATNRHGRIAIFYTLVYGAAAFVFAYLGAKSLGLSGAALALMLAELAMAAIVIHTALKMAHVEMSQWVWAVLKPPFALMTQVVALLRGNTSATPT